MGWLQARDGRRWSWREYFAASVIIWLRFEAVGRCAKGLSLCFTPVDTKTNVVWGIPRTTNAFIITRRRANYIARPHLCRSKDSPYEYERVHFVSALNHHFLHYLYFYREARTEVAGNQIKVLGDVACE